MNTDPIAIGLLLGLFVLLLILRMPIIFSLAASSIVTAIYLQIPLVGMLQKMADGVMNFSLLAIPFFVLMGEIMNEGGISRRIIKFANLLVGRLPGGLAMVNVFDSMFFGGISGSAVADVSSLGSIIIPMMKKQGYDAEFSVGLTVATACQGIIIPPSHNIIIFAFSIGISSQLIGGNRISVSIGRLYLGGYLPGFIMGICLLILAMVISKIRKYPRGERVGFKEGVRISIDAILAMVTAVIVVGGVITGIMTATEAAAAAALWAFIVTFFIYREIPIARFGKILYSSLKTLGIVMALIATAQAFGYLMAILHIPGLATQWLLTITDNYVLLLLLINVLLILLGMIMDMAPLILIVTPILFPVLVLKMGMNPVHFGIMLIYNLAIGLTTPPVGSALFVGAAVGKISLERATKGVLPFYIALLVGLMLVTFIPGITMWLPDLIMPN